MVDCGAYVPYELMGSSRKATHPLDECYRGQSVPGTMTVTLGE